MAGKAKFGAHTEAWNPKWERRKVFAEAKGSSWDFPSVYRSSRFLKTGLFKSVKSDFMRIPVFNILEDRSLQSREGSFHAYTGLPYSGRPVFPDQRRKNLSVDRSVEKLKTGP